MNESKFIMPIKTDVIIYENQNQSPKRIGIYAYQYQPTKDGWTSKEVDGFTLYYDGNGVLVAGLDSNRILGVNFE